MKATVVLMLCLSLFICFSTAQNKEFRQNGTWYKGDLHAHTNHSDGDFSVKEVLQDAENKGFTFFVITDHDAIYTNSNGTNPTWIDLDYHSENMILLYGVEWTTDNGHANIWNSVPFPYDSIYLANEENNPSKACEIANNHGCLFSVNHPANNFLTWNFNLDFNFQAMEIMNGNYLYNFSKNQRVISDIWEKLLLDGKRIIGVGGSDMHKLDSWVPYLYPNLGSPTTYVYSESKNAAGIIEAIKKGHVSISDSPILPYLELLADTDQNGTYDMMMGDASDALGTIINFRISIRNGNHNYSTVRLIKNGEIFSEIPVQASDSSIEIIDIPESRVFYRAELLNQSEPIAWTNPMYFGYTVPVVSSISDNFSRLNISIKPNPSNGIFIIESNIQSLFSIEIFSSCGKTIKSIENLGCLATLDLREYPNGVYFLKVLNRFYKVIKN